MVTNSASGTTIDEIAHGIYRINTPLDVIPGGFSFNSILIVDEEPVLFHTGYRSMYALNAEAVSKVLPLEKLRWVGGSHFESDEFGATNNFLAAAPGATPFGSVIGALTSLNDFADRPARGLADGEEFSIGSRTLKWLYTPHIPHGWDCGVLFDASTQTLLCGDLFTQPGANTPPVTETEVLSASEGMRKMLDYYAHASQTRTVLERLAALSPKTLACQHGSAYKGDGGKLILELAGVLEKEQRAATA
jgi:flavorubredoxin